jgi:hypothetical protein
MTAVTARRFSLAEYHPLGELGFLGPDDRVELIRPEIIIKAVKSTLHSVCNSLLGTTLGNKNATSKMRRRGRGINI